TAHVLLHSARAEMEVPPGGLLEYLEAAHKHDRANRRAELRKFYAAGNTVSWGPLTDQVTADVAELIAQNRARYGSQDGAAWIERSFAAQRRSGVLGDAIVGMCRRDGRQVAALVCFAFRRQLYARYFGFDYARARPAHEYFALSYGLAVDFAAQQGFR